MAPKVRIEPPPSRLLLNQHAIFEVLLIFMSMRMRYFSYRITARRDVPVGVPLEWHELPKYNGIQVSQLI